MSKHTYKIEWRESPTGCWECTSHRPHHSGYIRVTINHKKQRIHRYIYEQLFGAIPAGYVVMHKCDNPICINPEHLTIGTVKDNALDKVSKNRHIFGSKSPMSVLTENDVRFIKENHHKITMCKMAKMFSIGVSTINKILRREDWKHVQ